MSPTYTKPTLNRVGSGRKFQNMAQGSRAVPSYAFFQKVRSMSNLRLRAGLGRAFRTASGRAGPQLFLSLILFEHAFANKLTFEQFGLVTTPTNDPSKQIYGAAISISVYNLTDQISSQISQALLWIGSGIQGSYSGIEYGWTVSHFINFDP